jgi:hypothetical protein
LERRAEYTPKGIAFAPSYECPGGCLHCNIPFDRIDASAELDIDAALRVLREAKALGLHSFQFVGGEPTLRGDFMVELVKEGRRLSMKPHRPPTNCAAAARPDYLRDLFSRLKQAGFTAGFRVSCDEFHRRVPSENVAAFIVSAADFFDLTRFAIGCCDKDEERSRLRIGRVALLMADMGLETRVGKSKLETARGDIKLGFWAPTRPTWKPLPDSEFVFREVDGGANGEDAQKRGYPAPITRFGCLGPLGVGYVWIDPDGNARACCGNANLFSDKLIIGNIHAEPLAAIVERARRDPVISALADGGPVLLAAKTGLLGLLEKKYTHRCELCAAVLNA